MFCVSLVSKQVQASSPKFSVYNISKFKKTFLHGTTHLFQWESMEMILLELACKQESVLDLCFRRHMGEGQSHDGKMNTITSKMFFSRMREYTLQLFNTAALFDIFCIFTYTKYFQTGLCLFKIPHRDVW